jgi:hypothetical protein
MTNPSVQVPLTAISMRQWDGKRGQGNLPIDRVAASTAVGRRVPRDINNSESGGNDLRTVRVATVDLSLSNTAATCRFEPCLSEPNPPFLHSPVVSPIQLAAGS